MDHSYHNVFYETVGLIFEYGACNNARAYVLGYLKYTVTKYRCV